MKTRPLARGGPSAAEGGRAVSCWSCFPSSRPQPPSPASGSRGGWGPGGHKPPGSNRTGEPASASVPSETRPVGPAGSHVGTWGCPMGLTPPRPSPGVEVGVSCLVRGWHYWVGSRNCSRPWGSKGADHGAQGPSGSHCPAPNVPTSAGPVQGPTEGTRRTSSRCCRHEAAGDPHWRWGALSWGGSRHMARDTRNARPGSWGEPRTVASAHPGRPGGGGTPAQLPRPLLPPEPARVWRGGREGSAPH